MTTPRSARSIGNDGNAEYQLGPNQATSVHRGWYSRGYLPHCDHPGLLQAITYRLADSLPAAVVEQISAELSSLPPERRDPERRKRIEDWLDAGHGCCVLREPAAAACVVDTWQHFAGERYDLIAWVVMPNHVHVLIRTYEGVALGKIVQSWKSYTGRRIRRMMEEGRAGARRSQEEQSQEEQSQEGRSQEGSQEESQGGRSQRSRRERSQGEGSRGGGVWMREYWDRYIRNERHFEATVQYIHNNPVKAGLVKRAEDWPWSSAREFAVFAELGLGDPNPRDDGLGDTEPQLGQSGE